MYPGRFSENQHPDYEILGEISRGGMGVVVKAKQRELGRICALKLISICQDHPDSSRLLKRLEREAQALSRVRHRNIVALFTYNYEDRVPFIVMEHVEGEDLEKIFENKPQGFEINWLIGTFLQISEALAYCHDQGVIHRDVKLSNLILSPNSDGSSRPVLVDFGITKVAEQAVSRSKDGLSLTGELVGTPAYMSPEQLDPERFGEVSTKTDVWGLGVSLYLCLTGVLPFQSSNVVEILQKIYFDKPPEPIKLNGEIPKWLNSLVISCLTKEAQDRPEMVEVVTALRERKLQARHLSKFVLPCILLIVVAIALTVFAFNEAITDLNQEDIAIKRASNLPRYTDKAEFDYEARISGGKRPFKIGELRGESDEKGLVKCRLSLKTGLNRLSLAVLDGKKWVELKSFEIQVDTKAPLFQFDADFSSVCLAPSREAVSFQVLDSSPLEWSEGTKWQPVNSSGTVKLFADPDNPVRVLKARDAVGHQSQITVTILERDQWKRIRQSIEDWREWIERPKDQRRVLIDWLESKLGAEFQFKEMKSYGKEKRPLEIAVFVHKKTGMTFQLIPGGLYQMGSTMEEAQANLRFGLDYALKLSLEKLKKKKSTDFPSILLAEMPAHSVSIKAFLLAEHECTRAEWERFLRGDASSINKSHLPKANISWDELRKALKSLKSPFRLPSEAEWEYACRGTTKTRFYWGEAGGSHAWCFRNSRKHRHPYEEHLNERNRFGLIDMSGNVGEWCEDSYFPNYENGPKNQKPRIELNSLRKVVRGGSFRQGLGIARSSRRLNRNKDAQSIMVGFRFAISLPPNK